MQGNSGYILTVAEIDRETAEREREIEAIAATLVELDQHPGLVLLRSFPPIGKTAEHWAPAQQQLDLLWEDFGRLRGILEKVRAARARRRLDAVDREELTQLLRGRPLEVSRNTIPLARRTLTGPSHHITRAGFADTLDRMRAAFPALIEILDAVETVNNRVTAEIAPLQAQLDKAGAHRGNRSAFSELRELAHDIDELSNRAATDPLSLSPTELDRRLAGLNTRMRAAAALFAELDALAARWDEAVERTRGRIEALRRTYERADHARLDAEHSIATAALPVHTDDSAVFGAELTALEANPADPAALWDLRRRLTAAQAAAAHNEELAQGLLDRRLELRGRLDAYRAKAARLGVSEDRDVLAASRIAAGLLSRRPCDLAAVTRAITDYRQLIAMKSGRGL
ncbi:hypothetical protein [Nocardia inohanensis]|uniref:hypothetical protein n=1 Tax=Nocardia inohanensis TaxID=209246 RepID=UPI0008373D0C|nr:hypothetical protein [Nocardia inohanensis]